MELLVVGLHMLDSAQETNEPMLVRRERSRRRLRKHSQCFYRDEVRRVNVVLNARIEHRQRIDQSNDVPWRLQKRKTPWTRTSLQY